MIRLLPLLLILVCSACIQIGSDPQPMHYYLLESITNDTEAISNNKFNIDIELTKLPEYLDKQQIATSNEINVIEFSENHRWAESLQDNLIFTIRENITLQLPNANIAVNPWDTTGNGAIKLKLLINKFSGKLGDQAVIDIRWAFESGGENLAHGHFNYEHKIKTTYRDLVTKLNLGINQFSHELVNNLIK